MAEKSGKKNYTRWTDTMKFKLANLALKYGGYKRTGDAMEKKWQLIAELLSTDEEFTKSDVKSDGKSLYAQFKRLQEAVLKELGISEEGANLSGLAAEPSPYQLLIINMAEEVSTNKGAKDIAKEKKAKLQSNLLTHENNGLSNQIAIKHHVFDLMTAEEEINVLDSSTPPNDSMMSSRVPLDDLPEETSSSSSSSSSMPSKKKKRGASFMDKFELAAADMFEDSSDIKELEKRKLEKEIDAIDKQHAREERMLKLQEDQLEFARQEALRRAEEQANNKSMLMIMAKLVEKAQDK